MTALLLPFNPADIDDLNATLEERYAKYLDDKARVQAAAKQLLAKVRDRLDCGQCRGSGKHVSLTYAKMTPCPSCRPADYAERMAELAEEPCPPTERNSEVTHEQIDREADERLADLKRRRPWMFQRHEQDYPEDDGDIQPFERTTAYPWGRHD